MGNRGRERVAEQAGAGGAGDTATRPQRRWRGWKRGAGWEAGGQEPEGEGRRERGERERIKKAGREVASKVRRGGRPRR